MDFSEFEKTAGIEFKNKALLRQAFTHRSYINENREKSLQSNERLEYFGDSVLGFIVSDYLFARFPDMDEKELTTLRAALVNWDTCAKVGEKLKLEEFLLLSNGAKKDPIIARRVIIANALEALIGAIYEDQGFEVAKDFITKNILTLTDEIMKEEKWLTNSKSLFQEKLQKAEGVTPTYKILKESGPEHNPIFKVGVYIGNALAGEGEGKSKQDAEQEAARSALKAKNWE